MITAKDKNKSWWTSFSQIGSVEVVHLDLSPCEERESVAKKWLNRGELVRYERYVHGSSRRNFTLSRGALRAILCDKLNCNNEELSFVISKYGKPHALVKGDEVSISFNLSHSGEHGLIAFAPKGRVGIDIEERSSNPHRVENALTTFAPEEQKQLSQTKEEDKTHLFFSLWTIKEAMVKALGRGLTWDISQFKIPQAMHTYGSTHIYRFPQIPEAKWHIRNLGNDRFAAAVAFELGSKSKQEETVE